jgi:hypothetical protein
MPLRLKINSPTLQETKGGPYRKDHDPDAVTMHGAYPWIAADLG